MGSSPSSLPSSVSPQLQQSIRSCLTSPKLQLSHQSNIYEKCEFLLQHYKKFRGEFEELYLNNNMVSVEVMGLLGRMDLSNLKVLGLSFNDINCSAVKSFREAGLKNLHYLFLDHNLIGDDGCAYLARIPMHSLLTLDLSFNKIGDEGCKGLGRAPLGNLRTLLVSNNDFSERGLRFLSAGEWPLLAFVQAKNNSFEPNRFLQQMEFRSEINLFRLHLQ